MCLQLENEEDVPTLLVSGTMESHEFQRGRQPLLLSVNAQRAMRIMIDLPEGKIRFKDYPGLCLPLYQVRDTGLLAIRIDSWPEDDAEMGHPRIEEHTA